ncbi:hypothetical protein N7468_009086 [Penicillium chermesinum]|uniref:2-dehydropantoate 2-reductase n=1 Tax=Penicillium chermesinum TaxID=63820 RepID=A0A9W9NH51_9EURO|nr:uncharacterized protein N7468_009086 [Penicillium chermesinum]KAJ5219882.1 hypothetical protein N7468_009086 [Penicillium chermesinum]
MSCLLAHRSVWRKQVTESFSKLLWQTTNRSYARYLSTWEQDVEQGSEDSKKPPLSGRVHILGLGNVGSFIAHGLASRLPRPPITLLFHRPEMIANFRKRKYNIGINTDGLDDNKAGFDIEVLDSEKQTWYSVPTTDEERSKSSYRNGELPEDARPHRLTPDSTILIAQNGVGVVDMLNRSLWPDPATRPNYMQAVISHGLSFTGNFQVAHKGVGTMIISPTVTPGSPIVAAHENTDWAPSTKYLIRLLTLTPSLVAQVESPANLFQIQLEKLAINCIINPLTAIYECRNGELLYIFNATRVEARFAPERLRRLITQTMHTTSQNISSMSQDIKRRKPTEIEYLNGWIVRRGEELGMKCVLNYMLKQMVLTKAIMTERKHDTVIPIDTTDGPFSDSLEVGKSSEDSDPHLF